MTGPLRSAWFEQRVAAPGIRRLWEPHVHGFFRANIWHVAGRDADLVVDAGMGLRPLRPTLGLAGGKPALAVATHIHVDHVGSLHEFEHRIGHRAEAEGFAGMDDRDTLAPLFRTLADAVARPPSDTWNADEYRVPPAPLTRIVEEGDTIDLGDRRLTVLHLPGHSPGSIGLLDERDGLLFSGDALYTGRLVDDLPGSDRAAYRRTMARLLELDIRAVHGGHGDSLDRDSMRAIARDYLDRVP
ncbi:MBL fold metallo-hydrolase [Inquilinus limosus]|uniref:MBL fold metallo-hydrolase n=1 Tax=Inquilinus limosus TaxID=171674 RepID=A0A211ZN90_9PROT|nr:MBL fold metallo-hydrolase [Inquilinus limosus]OWJ66656.1 MBL fold metallo-hydrolase [Inquilinus limosus]